MSRIALVVTMVMAAHVASADDTVTFETHGVEIAVPGSWGKVDKGPMTVLGPKTYKSRAIEVLSLASMPADKTELQKILGDKDHVTILKAGPIDRFGTRAIVATAKAKIKNDDLDVDLIIFPVDKGATMIMSFLKADQDPILRKANEGILESARVAGSRITVEFTPTKTKGQGAPPKLVEFFKTKVAPSLDQKMLFPRPLPIRFLDCGQVNAFYSGATHDIKMCHELFDYLRMLFKMAKVPDDKAEKLMVETMVFTFMHEFGHAVVGEFGLPITGKGEDAADEFALLSLVTNGKNGQDAALAAAQWFELEVAQRGGKAPTTRTFFDEHTYDEARVGNILCMLYGADKVAYGPLAKKVGMPDRRLAFCLRDFPERKKTWDGMLAPHMRKNAPKAKPGWE